MKGIGTRTSLVISARVLLALLFVLGQGTGIPASSPHGFPDIPVTSTLNVTGSVTPNPGTNYRVEGDGNGPYSDGVSSVSSILQGGTNSASRDWILDTRSSTTRPVLVDLRTPVPNSGAVQIFSWQLVPTRIIVKCHEALNGSFLAIQLNQTVSCPMFVHFVYAGNDYRLSMTSGPGAFVNYPETNNALVTCTAVDASNQCNAWTIFPITQPDGTVQNIARFENLCRHCVGGTGDFYVTFHFNVTNP